MQKIRHESLYTSCNINPTPQAADWGKNNLICYAACNSIMIYDPQEGHGGKVIETFTGHTGRVNSVRWISGTGPERELISGSSDKKAIVWSLHNGKNCHSILEGHESNINIVDGLYKGPAMNNTIAVTVSMDETIRIWLRAVCTDNFKNVQIIRDGHSICVGLRLFRVPESGGVILGVASSENSHIYLYGERKSSRDNFELKRRVSLKGHDDWVRGLDFTVDGNSDLLLASSSQDSCICIWRITTDKDKYISHVGSSNNTNYTPSQNNDILTINGQKYYTYLDSLLNGHDQWVYSVNWNSNRDNLQLLSSSMDKSLIIWEFDSGTNLWVEKLRVGDVGGNSLGFYGGFFGPDGTNIFAYSYHGALHLWNIIGDERCVARVTAGGHFDEVTDLAWEPEEGGYLLTVSKDQTARVHAPWTKVDGSISWHEIARPQIHGYDLTSLAIISPFKYASSAEEKIIRTFEAPANFLDNYARICKDGSSISVNIESAPKGASVPSLGLSNKAVFDNGSEVTGSDKEDTHFTAVTLNEPPTEDTLLQNTLWPEIQKLYGHGYEVYSLAASPDGKFLASACKATTMQHAAVLIWDTSSWKQIQKLVAHSLTIVQISFSPNSKHLLTVSRDRRWCLFAQDPGDNLYKLEASVDKKTSIHTRIIWCCAWTHDSRYFVTGSRDGKTVVWTRNSHKDREKDSILGEFEAAFIYLDLKGECVTAVAFAPALVLGWYVMALGLESGVVLFYKWSPDQGWDKLHQLEQNEAHHLGVKRVAFRPVSGEHSGNTFQLASCGSDHIVRIHNLTIKF